jgi:hypothetical protein
LTILPPESRAGKFRAASTSLLLKVGVFGTTCPEVSECFLQVPQSLLKWDATNFVKKLQVFLLFPGSQHPGCLFVVNPLLFFVPSFCPSMQGFVVYQTNTT